MIVRAFVRVLVLRVSVSTRVNMIDSVRVSVRVSVSVSVCSEC